MKALLEALGIAFLVVAILLPVERVLDAVLSASPLSARYRKEYSRGLTTLKDALAAAGALTLLGTLLPPRKRPRPCGLGLLRFWRDPAQ